MRTRLAAAAVALVALTACSADTDPDEADVTFVQGMVPHHEQAVEMAQLVPDRTDDPDVRELAVAIEEAQGPEIETMQGWLDDWDVDEGHGDMQGMDHGADHAGMMSGADLDELAALSGDAFDRRWLELMIEHHEGAVTAAGTVLDDGEDPDVAALAKDIADQQENEIELMKELLR